MQHTAKQLMDRPTKSLYLRFRGWRSQKPVWWEANLTVPPYLKKFSRNEHTSPEHSPVHRRRYRWRRHAPHFNTSAMVWLLTKSPGAVLTCYRLPAVISHGVTTPFPSQSLRRSQLHHQEGVAWGENKIIRTKDGSSAHFITIYRAPQPPTWKMGLPVSASHRGQG